MGTFWRDPGCPWLLGWGRTGMQELPPHSWYKDQEPLEFSYPGYLALGEAQLSIIANAVNEGTYTCVVRRHQRVLTTYSWRVRVRS
jgi:hypothetical protein